MRGDTAAMRTAALLLLTLILGMPAMAATTCAPPSMLHAVMTMHVEGAPADAFINKPKVFYRMGTKLGRIEEAEDAEQGVHLLIVINEPHFWMVNLADRTGQHSVDEDGPAGNFHAPILQSVEPKSWREFETGCEEAFMKAFGVKGDVDEEGNIRYVRESDGVRAVLTVNRDHKPLSVDVAGPEMRFRVTYDTYEWLAPKPELFEKPKGIAFVEAKPEK